MTVESWFEACGSVTSKLCCLDPSVQLLQVSADSFLCKMGACLLIPPPPPPLTLPRRHFGDLPCARHCLKHSINTLNPPNNPVGHVPPLFPFYRWGRMEGGAQHKAWVLVKEIRLLEVRQLIHNRIETQSQFGQSPSSWSLRYSPCRSHCGN